MSNKYFLIPTTLGRAMLADVLENRAAGICLKSVAIGDADYTPSSNQSALMSEKTRVPINNISRPENNPAWLKISAVIPPDMGGWCIHEVGIFAENGNLFAIGKLDGSYKPIYQDGMVKEVQLDLILEISAEANVLLNIEPNVLTVTWDALGPYLPGIFAVTLNKDMELIIQRGENGDTVNERQSQSRFLLPRGSRFIKDDKQNLNVLIPS